MSSKVRVVFVIDGLREDGAQKALYLVCKHLDQDRFQVSVISLSHHQDMLSKFHQLGIRTIVLGIRYPWQIGRLVALYRLLRKMQPTIVNTLLSRSNSLGVLVAALAQVPIILASVRVCYPPERWARTLRERAVFRLVDCVTVVSSSTRQLVIEELRVPADRVQLVANGIDMNECTSIVDRTDLPFVSLHPEEYVVGTVGRLHNQKGHRYLIEAAQRVLRTIPDVHFVIVGDGCLDDQLRAMACSLGVADRMTFTGRLAHDLTLSMISRMDLFVLPSLYEGMPNALLEAMALGRPVVASAVDGNLDVVVDDETGVLVPPGDATALVNAIVGLVQDDILRARLGCAARNRVQSEFTAQKMVERLTTIYHDLMSTKLEGPL